MTFAIYPLPKYEEWFQLNNVILLLGCCKNGQDSYIRKAKNSIQRAKENAKKRTKVKTLAKLMFSSRTRLSRNSQ